MPDRNAAEPPSDSNPDESFAELLSQYERGHKRAAEGGGGQLEGTVVAISGDSVLLDIGYKTEGILPLSAFQSAGESVRPGDRFPVSVKGRTAEGYYELTRSRITRPADWSALERAFAAKSTIAGTVTGMVKGGFRVDVGVRAFMPASRSGVRDAASMENLVGQEIRCRIIKLDTGDEDVVVDRRIVAEEEERSAKERRYSEITEGDIVTGTVRSLTDYGAFVDVGGVDALLHVADLSWGRVRAPADVLSVGQQIEARVLKIDPDKQRISIGMKQLQPHPWDSVAQKYRIGERVRGTVTRLADFGAFVELEPGVEGLIHVSEMSWSRKVRKPGDVVKPGETVDVIILGVNVGEQRLSLGLKQALGDPWADAAQKFPVGLAIEGPVTSLTKFGAFVQAAEGVEGMIHVSEISADRHINHPQDVLKPGQVVRVKVLAVEAARRLLRLSMKQLAPTSLDEYVAERKEGDVVSGRVIEASGGSARVELGEGIEGTCRTSEAAPAKEQSGVQAKADLSSLGSMLQARWKGVGANPAASGPQALRAGQVRSFRIVKLDREAKTIGLEAV
ncbi:MAG TPA: S1 RNA-binding domain-containing protein [Candidatus Binatia bacterium]|nr:S1 RNA-binding domain-containing protein [Candidatus Binatia bacterium]